MIHDRNVQAHICELDADGVSLKISKALKGIKVSTHVFHTLLKSYENTSWGMMVTLGPKLQVLILCCQVPR